MAVDPAAKFATAGFNVVDAASRGQQHPPPIDGRGGGAIPTRASREGGGGTPMRGLGGGAQVGEAHLEAKRVDALAVATLMMNPEIVTENHAIFASLDSACTIDCERREPISHDIEFVELCEEIEGETTDKVEEEHAGRISLMLWIRPAANVDEASPSGTG